MSSVRNPGLLAWLHMMRVHSKLHHHSMEYLEEYNVTPAQFEVLLHLSTDPGITQQRLAEKLLVTKGNVCGLIDRLEAQGLVQRRSDPDDRRSNLLFLTDCGQTLAERVIPAHEEHIIEHMSALTTDQLRSLNGLLRDLDRSLDNH